MWKRTRNHLPHFMKLSLCARRVDRRNGKLQKCSSEENDFMGIVGQLEEWLGEGEMQLMVNVAHQIWLRRNSMVFGEEFLHPKHLVRVANDQVEAFVNASQRTNEPIPVSRSLAIEKWLKPPNVITKINLDAVVDRQNNKVGLGDVARNHERVIVATVCRSHSYISNLSTTEAMAARIAVELSNSLGLRDTILEGDALEVVQALNQLDMCCRSYG
jgi:hypothetical protein